MMRKMIRWRKENGVDAIRQDIIENKLFSPRYLVWFCGRDYWSAAGPFTFTMPRPYTLFRETVVPVGENNFTFVEKKEAEREGGAAQRPIYQIVVCRRVTLCLFSFHVSLGILW